MYKNLDPSNKSSMHNMIRKSTQQLKGQMSALINTVKQKQVEAFNKPVSKQVDEVQLVLDRLQNADALSEQEDTKRNVNFNDQTNTFYAESKKTHEQGNSENSLEQVKEVPQMHSQQENSKVPSTDNLQVVIESRKVSMFNSSGSLNLTR